MDARERLITATSAAILPLGLDGHPLHDRQEQIRAVVGRRLGQRHALLLAEAERRPGTDITDWYSAAAGTAVSAASMDEIAGTRLRGEVDALLADIDRLGRELESAKGTGARAAGRHLRLAARRPLDDTFLYCVGAQPVLVAWGHDDTRPAVKVAPAVAVAVATPVIATAKEVAEPQLPPPMPVSVQEHKKRGVFPWWLIATSLLAFLTGLGTAWILARSMPPGGVQIAGDYRRGVPVTIVLQKEHDRLAEDGGKLRTTLASLRQEFGRKRAACPPLPMTKPPEERVVCTRPPQRGRMMLIFDTSNSMGLPTDDPEAMMQLELRWSLGDTEAAEQALELVRGPGHKRIDDARAAGLDLVGAMPPNIDVGLVTFAGRCDVRVDVAPGQSRTEVTRELRSVTPRSGTPLAASLRMAMTQLSKDPALAATQSIVVITDGSEGCGGDPCGAARELKERFPSVKVHVIDVVGVSRMQCVADITGGSTVGAKDTEQLKAAVRRTQAAIEQDTCR